GIPNEFYGYVAQIAAKRGTKLILDTSGEALQQSAHYGVYLLKPNLRELNQLAGQDFEDDQHIDESARQLIAKGYAEVIVVSLGAGGARLVTAEMSQHVRAPTVPIRSKVGAGDTMVAGIVLSLARGWTLIDAVRYGVVISLGLVLLLVGVVGVVALFTTGGGDALNEVAARPTLTPSFTPTATATATPGVTSTPSPTGAAPEATFAPPVGLSRGSIYGGTPTPIYPDYDPGLGRGFEQAVALYSAQRYDQAFGTMEALRGDSRINCYPSAFYYQVIGLAEQGGRRNLEEAERLLTEYTDNPICAPDSLLDTANCFVSYQQGVAEASPDLLGQARSWCELALQNLRSAPPIVLAVTTLARLDLLAEDYNAAAARLDSALRTWESNLHLLLLRAEVEVQRGNLNGALEYLNRALYVDPVAEEALHARVQAYLGIAAQATDPERQLRLYGTAVLYTLEYLLYHAGNPRGYLLLAQARLGEGNLDLAEAALDRVILNATTLPPEAAPVVQQAYALRAQLYRETARYQAALDDVEVLLGADSDDPDLLAQQTELALAVGEYAIALDALDRVITAAPLEEIEDEAERAQQLAWRLLRWELSTETCALVDALPCEYDDALEALTDAFIRELPEARQPIVRGYRAKAAYHVALDTAEELGPRGLQNALNAALDDLESALDVQQTPLNVYYQGLIQEALEQPERALAAYRWVNYWAQFYDYPFAGAVAERIAALEDAAEDAS
ncbi:MAG: hypothetical protein HC927_00235, partial [Deltaproteobacteria bacterium]|nr:hypothetical protein [Deltaproteobacteria bacterium]